MTKTVTAVEKESSNESLVEDKKGIESHIKAAEYFEEAAKHHREAAKHHENGDHDKAAISTVKAHGNQVLANQAQKEDTKYHALLNKRSSKPEFNEHKQEHPFRKTH